ncbi:thioesterase family protein [cf. Phormidesmis sp. LEGE 11477]|uniref:acyl-CoA thioesterase n=1 Tax=cf. Phormidesmis sp. LEGE 11477 TaxID=1828680 RepID=UPI00187FAE15|nr:hypothetical protein [cf. Phormidesmis sp. LEGE 11477]
MVRSHAVEYLRPAFEEEQLVVLTWIASVRKVQSQRKYQFFRPSDKALLATGKTNWVFVNRSTGKPQAIPPAVANAFEVVPDSKELDLKSFVLQRDYFIHK